MAIASEDEWYKAAYYAGLPTAADGDGYWLYPTQSNSITTADANYDGTSVLDPAGSYTHADSYYGTFDQGGNVGEWTDAIVDSTDRVRRGRSFSSSVGMLASSMWESTPVIGESSAVGFRVTSLELIAPVPEPSTTQPFVASRG